MSKKGMEQALMSPQEKKLKAAAMNVLTGNKEEPSGETMAADPGNDKEEKSTGKPGKTARIDVRVKEDVKADLVALAAINGMNVTEYIENLVTREKKKNRKKLETVKA